MSVEWFINVGKLWILMKKVTRLINGHIWNKKYNDILIWLMILKRYKPRLFRKRVATNPWLIFMFDWYFKGLMKWNLEYNELYTKTSHNAYLRRLALFFVYFMQITSTTVDQNHSIRKRNIDLCGLPHLHMSSVRPIYHLI